MKKKIVFLLVFFAFISNVKADTCAGEIPKYAYECKSHGEVTSSNCGFNTSLNSDDVDKLYPVTEKNENIKLVVTPDPKESTKGYNFFIVLDDSNSMVVNSANLKEAKKAINSIVGKLNSKGFGENNINIFTFNDKFKCTKQIKNGKGIEKCLNDKHKLGDSIFKNNTDFVTAFKNVKKKIGNVNVNKPVVIFMTDGYPTQSPHKDVNTLGYLSSASLFFDATVEFNKLIRQVKAKDGMIFTFGVNLSAEDKMASYLLSPSQGNYDALAASSNDEDKRYFKLINGAKKTEVLVAGIGSSPDYGIVGYTPKSSKNKKKVYFDNVGNLKQQGKQMSSGKGLFIGPIKKDTSIYDLCNGSDESSCKRLSRQGEFLVLKKDITKWKKWVLRSKKNIKIDPDSFSKVSWTSDDNKDFLDSGVQFFTTVNKQTDSSVNSITDLIKSNTLACSKQVVPLKKISYDKYCRSGSIDKYKITSDGCSYYDDKQKKKISLKNIKVDYIVVESLEFDAGSLADKSIISFAGGGFPFTDIKFKGKSRYYFKYYGNSTDGGFRTPLVSVSYSGEVPGEKLLPANKITCKGVGNLWNGGKYMVRDVKDKIYNFNNIKANEVEFKTVNSNDKDILDEKVHINKVVSGPSPIDGNQNVAIEYDFTYNVQNVKRRDGTRTKFDYGNDASFPISGQYFIPFGYKQNLVTININGNAPVTGFPFSDRCYVRTSAGGYPENYVSYRSIDINNPFPKVSKGNEPFNWRGYDSLRLQNSYSYLNYSIGSINNVKYMDDYNYSSFDSIDTNGKSSFIRKNSGIIYDYTNSGKVCAKGKWSTSCDQYR